jgi:uncharacterized protein involved in exopolysaccharide biosynthesis
MGLRELFRKDPTLKKALAWGLAAGLLTAGYTLTMPNQYTSEILVLPSNNGGSPLSALASAAGMLGVGGLGKTDDAYYPDILTSRWLAGKLLDSTYHFTYKGWYFGAPQHRVQTIAAFLKADTPQKRESALETVQDWLTATSDIKTGVLHIKVEAPSPELAQELTDRAADLLDEALKTRVQGGGSAKAAYAKARLAQAKEEVDRARQTLVSYAEAHRNLDQSPDPAVRAQGQALMAELALRQQIATNVALGYEQAELEARNNVPVLSRLSDAYLPAQKTKPRRSTMVLAAFFAVSAGLWLWLNRDRLHIDDGTTSHAG